MVIGSERCELGNLWLEGTRVAGSGVDDSAAKFKYRIRSSFQHAWKPSDIGVESDTQQGIMLADRIREFSGEGHKVSVLS